MIKKLRLHNFKTYLNAEIALSRRHLLIGRNNSGKSNLCAGLSFLASTVRGELSSAAGTLPGGVFEIRNRALQSNLVDIECVCGLVFESQELEFTYALSLAVGSGDRRVGESPVQLTVAHEQLRVDGAHFKDAVLLESDGHQAEMLQEEDFVKGKADCRVRTRAPADSTMLAKLYQLDTNRRAIHFRKFMDRVSYFNLSPLAMKFDPNDNGQSAHGLGVHGHGLSSALFQLKNSNERRYREVIEFIRTNAEPGLEAINFLTAPNQRPLPVPELSDARQAVWTGLSDGTMRLLALAYIVQVCSALADMEMLCTVVIEEPENGVYPGLLRKLIDYIDDRAARTQFIFTSHSPYFINLFDGMRESVSYLRRNNERTEIMLPPVADFGDPDRELLAEEYVMELFGG